MKAEKSTTKEALQELAQRYLKKNTTETSSESSVTIPLQMDSYLDRTLAVSSLINLCIWALQSEERQDPDCFEDTATCVGSVLHITLQLLPHDEAEYLDRVRELV